MSKRFGRNQRRRAREEAARLAGEVSHWRTSYLLEHALCEEVARLKRRLEDELNEAKDIAHNMSHLFPATEEFDQSERKPPMRGEMFMVDIPGRLADLDQFITEAAPIEQFKYRRTPLALLLSSVHPDAIQHGVQARVRFANNDVAYGITAAGWHTLTSAQRIARIQHEIAPALARLLVETTDLRRYT